MSSGDQETGQEKTEVSFSDFAFLQYQQAKLSLGEIPNPATGKYEVILPLAQYSIEVLTMLKEKTKGNLTSDEERLVENVLHELRMTYVDKMRSEEEKAKADEEEKETEKTETGNESAEGEEPAEAEEKKGEAENQKPDAEE